MSDQTIALLLTIAPICAFAFAGLFLEALPHGEGMRAA